MDLGEFRPQQATPAVAWGLRPPQGHARHDRPVLQVDTVDHERRDATRRERSPVDLVGGRFKSPSRCSYMACSTQTSASHSVTSNPVIPDRVVWHAAWRIRSVGSFVGCGPSANPPRQLAHSVAHRQSRHDQETRNTSIAHRHSDRCDWH